MKFTNTVWFVNQITYNSIYKRYYDPQRQRNYDNREQRPSWVRLGAIGAHAHILSVVCMGCLTLL